MYSLKGTDTCKETKYTDTCAPSPEGLQHGHSGAGTLPSPPGVPPFFYINIIFIYKEFFFSQQQIGQETYITVQPCIHAVYNTMGPIGHPTYSIKETEASIVWSEAHMSLIIIKVSPITLLGTGDYGWMTPSQTGK